MYHVLTMIEDNLINSLVLAKETHFNIGYCALYFKQRQTWITFLPQESFIDTYANLTLKSLLLLRWFTQRCEDSQYVMKTDDDVYINLVKLHQLVLTNREHGGTFRFFGWVHGYTKSPEKKISNISILHTFTH